MKKAKNILNTHQLSRAIIWIAVLLAIVAVLLVLWCGIRGNTADATQSEYRSVVVVAAGDTLSSLLTSQGFTNADVLKIASVLKSDANITSLRADSDKIEFVRPDEAGPISKIVIIPSPWRKVEITCDADGQWNCTTVDVERDTRAVYRSGTILDGDSFYLAGARAGIPDGILAEVYDLLAFEMDFERDVRAGQHFSVLYEENYSNGKKIDNGRVLAVQFQALRGNVKMYRFRKSDGKTGYYDENGNGAIKSLKRTPINNARITSSFPTVASIPSWDTRAHTKVLISVHPLVRRYPPLVRDA